MNNYEIEPLPKHKKKKESNISKSKSKSKHKHEYADCILMKKWHSNLGNGRTSIITARAKYCIKCGKIGKMVIYESEKTEKGFHRILTNEEVLKKYPNFPIFYVNWKDKYVTIEGENDD